MRVKGNLPLGIVVTNDNRMRPSVLKVVKEITEQGKTFEIRVQRFFHDKQTGDFLTLPVFIVSRRHVPIYLAHKLLGKQVINATWGIPGEVVQSANNPGKRNRLFAHVDLSHGGHDVVRTAAAPATP